jgi:serine/threonine-protein kinase
VFEAASVADVVLQQASSIVTPLTSIVKHLDPAVERAIMRCLEREPERRPSSALAVAASLPGGDPLAAAVGAGETPSPELVAAAGSAQAALSISAGLAWIGLLVAALAAVALLMPHQDVLSLLPVEKPRAVLEDRALDVVSALGAPGPVIDTASGFEWDRDYLSWLDHRMGIDRREQIRRGRPAPMRFWLRTSPRTLVPIGIIEGVDLGDEPDPPLTSGGMTAVQLDLAGRLLGYIAVPPPRDAPDAARPVTNWEPAFRLAALDSAAFHEVPSTWAPDVNSDERRAWQGTIQDLPDTPLTIEGAASHGAIVQFTIRGPWSRPAHQLSGSVGSPQLGIVIGPARARLVFVLIIGGVLWAWRNYVNGRGDRRGARRVAIAVMLMSIAKWVLAEGHVHGIEELNRFFIGLGPTLLLGVIAYACYLAAEPFVRRVWPHSLISWSRLLAGRYRDPLVGRDLLIGIAMGVAIAAVWPATVMVSLARHLSDAISPEQPASLLLGWRQAWTPVVPIFEIMQGLFLLLVVTAARFTVKRGWLALLVACAVLASRDLMSGLMVGAWSIGLIGAIIVTEGALVLTLARFGLLAVSAALFASNLAGNAAFSFHWALPHVAYSWPPMLFLVSLALVGFWMATSVGVTSRASGLPSQGAPAA